MLTKTRKNNNMGRKSKCPNMKQKILKIIRKKIHTNIIQKMCKYFYNTNKFYVHIKNQCYKNYKSQC